MKTVSESWQDHMAIGTHFAYRRDHCPRDEKDRQEVTRIEPWLASLFRSEHINLLVGNGLTTALTRLARTASAGMSPVNFSAQYATAVDSAADTRARNRGREKSNIEDQINAANDFIAGFEIVSRTQNDATRKKAKELCTAWGAELDRLLGGLVNQILSVERDFDRILSATAPPVQPDDAADDDALNEVSDPSVVRRTFDAFLLPVVHRPAGRDRCHIFTTNYDRFIEYGCELLGLRIMDRFVGTLTPVFRSSRLDVDMHYDPPGIRGEPRYLEGVVRLTKLHGSLDWRHGPCASGRREVHRCALPFGAESEHPEVPTTMRESLLIYPNAAKDVETTNYPYADLFRDFAAALCRPNSVLVTYGYGFGDAHVNRVLRDMLTIPSTHIVIIAYGDSERSVRKFYETGFQRAQVTLLSGSHFGDLRTLVDRYWPKPPSYTAFSQVAEEIQPPNSPVCPGEDDADDEQKDEGPS